MNIPRSRINPTEHFPFKTCGDAACPVCTRSQAVFKVKPFLSKQNFSGSAPAPFIGHYGYPDVNVGILSPATTDEQAWLYDAPRVWAQRQLGIKDVVAFRSGLINSRGKAHIKNVGKLVEVGQDVGMASRPVDIDVQLQKKPVFRLNLEQYAAPTGPAATLKDIDITSNPHIPRSVDKAVSDTDLKAADAMQYLYGHDIDENYLTRLISVGTLGIGKNRKLVPTRWSITATDDTLGKFLTKKVRDFDNQIEFSAYFGGYMGNYFLVLFFPSEWGFELFETYVPKNASMATALTYTTDSEFVKGRTAYAANCAGGYYAARLPVAEAMLKQKRQGSALALRFITDEYTVPLGVWVVREAVRKALEAKPLFFESRALLLDYARKFIQGKFGVDAGQLLDESKILKEMRMQTKLNKFL